MSAKSFGRPAVRLFATRSSSPINRTDTAPYLPSTAPAAVKVDAAQLQHHVYLRGCLSDAKRRTSLGPDFRINSCGQLLQTERFQGRDDSEQVRARRQHERVEIGAISGAPWKATASLPTT